jgi:hypothetical protein
MPVGLASPQIASSDLDIAVVGQLAATNLPLGDEFQPGSVVMVGFEAAFGRRGLWKQDLKHAPRQANDTGSRLDIKLDDGNFGGNRFAAE